MKDDTFYKSFMAGTFGGLCGISISHPFDTLRVRIQTENKFTYRGIRDMYKGIGPPLFGVMLEKTIVFGSYNFANVHLNRYFPDNPMLNHFGAGVFSGIACTSIVTPVERVKINLQNSKSEYKNSAEYLRQTIQKSGFRSLYRGWTSTLTREMPGYGIYFWTYESLRQRVNRDTNMALKSFLMGGLSGAFAWLFIYPSDVIKSRLQLDGNKYTGIVDCARKSVKADGIGVFYRGFYTALLRAVPLHAGVFMGYELFMRT